MPHLEASTIYVRKRGDIIKFKKFSQKQLETLTWWLPQNPHSSCDAVICDGAVRSGKTLCMAISFLGWASANFSDASFAICGKTLGSLRRNVITPILPVLQGLGFSCEVKFSENTMKVSSLHGQNRFYFFSGKDESSASLIQGITLSGILFDEVALMPKSFVEQALARCSAENAKFWFNCNPEHPGHWFYREWISEVKEKNALYLHFEMDDNPSLSERVKTRYRQLYTGAFFERFVLGKWTATQGAIYPEMAKDWTFCEVPEGPFEKFSVSCDYGTVNPASFGLWGKKGRAWYRLREYYYDSRKEGQQRTDEEHYQGLCELTDGLEINAVTIDPSAASFIEVVRRHGVFRVVPAKNNVVDGIRRVSTALKNGDIKICKTCKDAMNEFGLYRWENAGGRDLPLKENDHAMDDIRYFVATLLTSQEDYFFAMGLHRTCKF